MKCPHCLENFHDTWFEVGNVNDNEGVWHLDTTECPACRRAVIRLQRIKLVPGEPRNIVGEELVRPRAPARAPLPREVPETFASDYREACLVLPHSAKASAALSRRCLQNLLREKARVQPSDLFKEIEEVLESRALPSHLADALDAVRNIGNFAAHPIKSTNTGGIVDVEPGEAEWSLDVLEGLFDFYFVAPAALQRKKETLNEKLAEAGKPPMK